MVRHIVLITTFFILKVYLFVVLRQFALSTFKKEISDLRNQVHQISMERDKLKGNLNRTTEEKQRIITEGDEHVDMIAKKSEKEKRYFVFYILSIVLQLAQSEHMQ